MAAEAGTEAAPKFAADLPEFVKLEDWMSITGISRSCTYEALGRGDIIAYRNGKRLLFDLRHGIAWIRTLPLANIKPLKEK